MNHLAIKKISGGGYIITGESDRGMMEKHDVLYACSTLDEALEFIEKKMNPPLESER